MCLGLQVYMFIPSSHSSSKINGLILKTYVCSSIETLSEE